MAQIYDSTHSGQQVDAAVDAALTTIPNQLTQIGLKIGDLTQLETEEKDNLVDAINEVKNNANTTAQNTSYTDKYGIGATNVQDAIDKVGFVGTDTEIDLTQYTEQRAYISPDALWITSNNTYKYQGKFIPVTSGSKYRITSNNAWTTYYAYLTSNVVGASNSTVTTFAGGATTTTRIEAGEISASTAPADAKYMWFFNGTAAGLEDRKPQKIETVKESISEYLANADTKSTKNSSRLITSGGVYNSIAPIDEELHGKTIYNGYTEGIYVDQGTGNIISNADWALTDYIPISSPSSVKVRFMTTGGRGISCLSLYDASKQWSYSYSTNNYTNEREVLNDTMVGIAYMRCGLYLPNIEQCEVYVDGELVWNYGGRIDVGWTYSDVKQKVEDVDINNYTLYEGFVKGKIIDARVSSETFGQEIEATSTDWACTQYIDISKANGGIKYVWQSGSPSNNYYGKGGVVFYDAEHEPLTEGVRVIKQTSIGTASVETDAVPEGAVYMRASVWIGAGKTELFYSLYKLVPDNIFGLDKVMEDIDTTVYAEELSILRNARYSGDGSTSGSIGLLHFSDIHGDEGAAKAIRAFYDRYSAYISDMLSTGDVPYYYYADGIEFYKNANLTDALLALGNHDGAVSSNWDGVGAQVDYETYYAPYIAGWGVTQPTDAAANYLMYYYKDYTSASLRLIVLDVMHQDAAQLQWFTDTLAAARTSGYAVIVASHYIPNTFTEDYIVKRADGEKTSFQYYLSNEVISIDARFKLNTVYADAVETFIAGGGEFVIWLCGHYHTDYFTYSNTHPNILFCAINQAGYRRGGALVYRNVGDHCANFVAVNKALGMVKIYRIGLKKDKFLRPINVLTYDYVNKKVVTNY